MSRTFKHSELSLATLELFRWRCCFARRIHSTSTILNAVLSKCVCVCRAGKSASPLLDLSGPPENEKQNLASSKKSTVSTQDKLIQKAPFNSVPARLWHLCLPVSVQCRFLRFMGVNPTGTNDWQCRSSISKFLSSTNCCNLLSCWTLPTGAP